LAFSTGEAEGGLGSAAPDPGQVRLAAGVVAALVLACAAAAPFAEVPLAGTALLVPAYGAAFLVNEIITTVLLLASYWVRPSRAVLVLAVGYLFSGLMVVPWVLTFPGVFAATGLLDAGLQGTAFIAALRRIGFPLAILAYALLAREGGEHRGDRRRSLLIAVAGTVAAVVGVTLLVTAGEELLPVLMRDSAHAAAAWQVVPASAALLSVAAILLLWRRCRCLLDLWLMVVLATVLIEILLLSVLAGGGRFTVGWWAGRIYGLLSASFVLFVLLAETTTLYGRLLRSVAAERRVREARLAGLEALSASIAHEVSQPLSSMVTNADAGSRWLDRPAPDLAEARAALARIGGDGERARRVIDGMRALFGRGRPERRSVHVDSVIDEVLESLRTEIDTARATVERRSEPGLPRVAADPSQLAQVVSNLLMNALEAMAGLAGGPKVLHVSARRGERSEVVVEIGDSGRGVGSDLAGRIFEPFVTSKAHGMGMGLMICRSIIDSHGGRLWLERTGEAGSLFAFSLPADPDPTAGSAE